MRYEIHYVTRFQYAKPVRESQNELRACPTTDDRQRLLGYRVSTHPPTRIVSYEDYWRTRVDTFGVRDAHDRLVVTVDATVETGPSGAMTAAPTTQDLFHPAFRDLHWEYLQPSPHTSGGDEIRDEARAHTRSLGGDVANGVLAVYRAIGTHLKYRPGSTYVGVPIDDVLERGEGVCQDFAHLMIAQLRALDIPARYVSGYFFAASDDGGEDTDDDRVRVQTHAWVEVAVPGFGWWALDPTNQVPVGERHIKIGHGRDYDDVPPLRGVYTGHSDHELTVGVTIRRIDPQLAHPVQVHTDELLRPFLPRDLARAAAPPRDDQRRDQQQQQQQQ